MKCHSWLAGGASRGTRSKQQQQDRTVKVQRKRKKDMKQIQNGQKREANAYKTSMLVIQMINAEYSEAGLTQKI